MPHKDPAARRAYLRKRYAERADVRKDVADKLAAWRKENPTKVSAQNKRNYSKQKSAARVRNRLWYEQNRGALRVKRGLPAPTRPEPAVCELCGGANARRKALALDHCHVTGHFRGWLCIRCNAAIGALGDSIEGLLRAVEYLRRAERSS